MAQQTREYRGPERRRSVDRRDLCIQVDRLDYLERMCRENARGLHHVTSCLEGYKGFVDLLKRREEQRIQLRQKLIDTLISRGALGLFAVIVLLIWAGLKTYVKIL